MCTTEIDQYITVPGQIIATSAEVTLNQTTRPALNNLSHYTNMCGIQRVTNRTQQKLG